MTGDSFEDLPSQITGLGIGAVAMAYFIGRYNRTHRFSYLRLGSVLCAGAILFAPAVYVAGTAAVEESSWSLRAWCGVAVFSLMSGTVVAISCLGLGCGGNGGVMSSVSSRILKCQIRSQNPEALAMRPDGSH